MLTPIASLAAVMAIATLAPYIASLIPGRPVPEVVFLVFAGALLGSHGFGVIDASSQAMGIISDLGVGFLFMLAGYEIEPDILKTKTALIACLSWLVSLILGIVLVRTFLVDRVGPAVAIPFAIALTTTSYGTLAPIVQDRGLNGTRSGDAITVYGATGELLPVIAMSILMSARTRSASLLVLLGFLAACIAILVLLRVFFLGPTRRFGEFLKKTAWSGARPLYRVAVLLLLGLLALAQSLELDLVLGAFAAGFLLRGLFPDASKSIAEKLEDTGNGLLIPCFFVISGTSIDLPFAAANFGIVMGVVGLLVLVRGVVVGISLQINPDTRDMSWQEKFSVSAYCTLALSLIVAITHEAVASGAMTQSLASILVTAGALTVLLIPIITAFVRVADEASPIDAVREVTQGELSAREAWLRHRELVRLAEKRFRQDRRQLRGRGRQLSSADYLALLGREAELARAAMLEEAMREAMKRWHDQGLYHIDPTKLPVDPSHLPPHGAPFAHHGRVWPPEHPAQTPKNEQLHKRTPRDGKRSKNNV